MAPEKRGFYEYHASLVEPWDGYRRRSRLHRRHAHRRRLLDIGTGSGRREVRRRREGELVRPRRAELSASSTSTRRTWWRRGGSSRGRCSSSIRRRGGSWATRRSRPRSPRASRTRSGSPRTRSSSRSSPRSRRSSRSRPTRRRERLQRAFGYTREDVRVLLAPMAEKGEEPTGSMGNDAPLAVLSDRPMSLFRYFKQQFAQVTNPPIDPIREELVMSLVTCVGGEGNLLEETPRQCRLLELPHPILSNAGLAKFLAGGARRLPAPRTDPGHPSPSAAIRRRRWQKRSRRRARGRRARSTRGPRSSSSRTATWTPGTRRSRACSPPRPCTTT